MLSQVYSMLCQQFVEDGMIGTMTSQLDMDESILGAGRPGVRQPILTQYCDGRKVLCPRWMTQWGSCSLGQQGYSPIEILRYYYGDSMYINTAEQIAGIPASWPGYD